MRKLALTIAAGALLASGAHADWLLSDYATVAADSATVNKIYGIQSFGNKASVTSVAVSPAGAVSLIGTKIASDGTEGYTANIGMLHPLKKDWSAVKLTGITGISFDIRYSVKPTDGVEVGFGSKVIPDVESNAGHSYTAKLSGSLLPAAANTWKTVTLAPEDFVLPTWWVDVPLDFPTLDAVFAGGVEQIQFAPKTAYSASGTQAGTACTKCVTPTTTAITLDVRNITLLGVEATSLVNPERDGCLGIPVVTTLDAFEDGDNVNDLGGYWYAFSDTSSAPAKALDSATGSSISTLAIAEGEIGLSSGLATAAGSLNKNVAGSPFLWRPYAGWFAVGTGFEGESDVDLSDLTGIEFSLEAKYLGPQVKGIKFKVAIAGVGDAYTHYAFIPARQITKTSADYATSVCVRPEDLKQADWVKAPNLKAFSSAAVSKLSWEAAIEDQASPSIFKDSANFTLTNIKFYGVSPATIGVQKRLSRASFGASYRDGILSVQRVAGVQSISVVSPSGKILTQFDAATSAKSLRLDRGTYFVVAKKANGETMSRKLAVMN